MRLETATHDAGISAALLRMQAAEKQWHAQASQASPSSYLASLQAHMPLTGAPTDPASLGA